MTSYDTLLSLFSRPRRKVFISYYKGDKVWLDQFVKQWGPDGEGVFTPKALGVNDDDFVDSDDPKYVMSQIREKYLEDSSVTIILVGSCTHSRRYVDWEIKSSLRQVLGGLPNGLIGVLLPPRTSAYRPERFRLNQESGYATYHFYPRSADELRGWIENANDTRVNRARLIINSQDMMKYNAKCQICGIVHST